MNVFRLSRRRITEILNDNDDNERHEGNGISDSAKRFLNQAIKFQNHIPDSEDSTVHKIERDLGRVIKNLYILIEQIED